MKNKPVIAVDIDDVLADSTDALRIVVNERLGISLLPEHYAIPGDYWGYYEHVWQLNGAGGRVSLDDLDPQMKASQSHILPHAGAAEVLAELSKTFTLIVVTARNSNWRDATEIWLEYHFKGLFSNILFADGHEGLKKKSKGQICAEHNVAWLIDDNVGHAQTAIDNGVGAILFGDYGWQNEVPLELVRCKNWQAVGEYLNGIA